MQHHDSSTPSSAAMAATQQNHCTGVRYENGHFRVETSYMYQQYQQQQPRDSNVAATPQVKDTFGKLAVGRRCFPSHVAFSALGYTDCRTPTNQAI